MAPTSSKSKKRSASKRRAPATSSLVEPVIVEASSLASLSAFSPSGDLFAHISLAVDKHQLRVYNISSSKIVSEKVFQDARVTCMHWIDPSRHGSGHKRRKKRKSETAAEAHETSSIRQPSLAIGLSSGSLIIFSAPQGEVTHALSSPKCQSSILSISPKGGADIIWTSSSDGSLQVWDIGLGRLVNSWASHHSVAGTGRRAYSAISYLSSGGENTSRLLVAHHTIKLVSAVEFANDGDEHSESSPLRDLATFGGHASSVSSLQWISTSGSGKESEQHVFASIAEGDRFISLWQTPSLVAADGDNTVMSLDTKEGRLLASIPLDTDVRSISLAKTPSSLALLALSASGTLRVFPIPTPSASPSNVQVQVIGGGSNIFTSPSQPLIVSAQFVTNKTGARIIRIARLLGGLRPIFDSITFLDDEGNYIPQVKVEAPAPDSVRLVMDAESGESIPYREYSEKNGSNVRTAHEVALDGEDANALATNEAELDGELAELSLGEKLAARAIVPHLRTTNTNAENPADNIVPSHVDPVSLTRTLIQALHSNNAQLLESVLRTKGEILILNTVRKLPAPFAVPLVRECVARLNRGRGAGLDGAKAARGSVVDPMTGKILVKWLRATLITHTSHLLSDPQLVQRLASLHATITSRVSLQDRLLALQGRLDLVLSQVEMRSRKVESALPAPAALTSRGLAVQKAKWEEEARRNPKDEALDTYVEGESEDEIEEDEEVEVEKIDEDNDNIEDVQLGEESAEESDSGMEDVDDEVDDDEEDEEMSENSSEDVSQGSEDED